MANGTKLARDKDKDKDKNFSEGISLMGLGPNGHLPSLNDFIENDLKVRSWNSLTTSTWRLREGRRVAVRITVVASQV